MIEKPIKLLAWFLFKII